MRSLVIDLNRLNTSNESQKKKKGFRLGTATDWTRQALSAYSWTRTDRGPQKQWLHRIGRAENPHCPCDPHVTQSGEHLVFDCPLHTAARQTFIPGKRSWEELDSPHWIKTGPNERGRGHRILHLFISSAHLSRFTSSRFTLFHSVLFSFSSSFIILLSFYPILFRCFVCVLLFCPA